jgi:hypothetical protein
MIYHLLKITSLLDIFWKKTNRKIKEYSISAKQKPKTNRCNKNVDIRRTSGDLSSVKNNVITGYFLHFVFYFATFDIPIFRFWAYMMKVSPDVRRISTFLLRVESDLLNYFMDLQLLPQLFENLQCKKARIVK